MSSDSLLLKVVVLHIFPDKPFPLEKIRHICDIKGVIIKKCVKIQAVYPIMFNSKQRKRKETPQLVAYAVFLDELLKKETCKLRSLVCSDNPGDAIETDAFFKGFYNQRSRNTKTNLNAQRESAEEVFNCHNLNASDGSQGIKEEIYGPDMIAKLSSLRGICTTIRFLFLRGFCL